MTHDQELPPSPRPITPVVRPGALITVVAVTELVFAVFLFWMSRLSADAPGGYGLANTFGAVTALVALLMAGVLWLRARSGASAIRSVAVLARLLPVLVCVVVILVAVVGTVPWLAVLLCFFAACPVAVLGMVLRPTRVQG